MNTLDRTDLEGARWSSAVRCIARAQHEALGTRRDENAQELMADFFIRGVSAADAWVDRQLKVAEAAGKELIPEKEVPWGPPEFGWIGHADAVLFPDNLVIEAYHAVGGAFRREKALQAVGYARQLAKEEGEQFKAMLAVLDTTDVEEDAGFAVTYIPLDTEELGKTTDAIMHKVALAAIEGQWNPADRVADTPAHHECRNCPFRAPCWEDWIEPEPIRDEQLEPLGLSLVELQSQRIHMRAALSALDEEIQAAREVLRPHLPPGRVLVAGGSTIKRIEIAPRRNFRFAAYEGAGHLVTPTMREFLAEGESGERWYVGKVA